MFRLAPLRNRTEPTRVQQSENPAMDSLAYLREPLWVSLNHVRCLALWMVKVLFVCFCLWPCKTPETPCVVEKNQIARSRVQRDSQSYLRRQRATRTALVPNIHPAFSRKANMHGAASLGFGYRSHYTGNRTVTTEVDQLSTVCFGSVWPAFTLRDETERNRTERTIISNRLERGSLGLLG